MRTPVDPILRLLEQTRRGRTSGKPTVPQWRKLRASWSVAWRKWCSTMRRAPRSRTFRTLRWRAIRHPVTQSVYARLGVDAAAKTLPAASARTRSLHSARRAGPS